MYAVLNVNYILNGFKLETNENHAYIHILIILSSYYKIIVQKLFLIKIESHKCDS